MNKTYSEQQQAILFRAAREMRKVAGQVLDDVQTDVEFQGSTKKWAKDFAASIARRANALEDEGHTLTVASARAESELAKSHRAYSASIDAFEKRAAEHARPDVRVTDEGTISVFDLSSPAQEWWDEHVAEGPSIGRRPVVEHRLVESILCGLQNAGFTIEVS